MNTDTQAHRRHAIVIGGSMGGLLAARVLSDYYQEVTIVERDSFPAQPEQRRGVPQGRHTHGLLASGREVLERLFPGISQALVEAGAVKGDIVRDCRWFFEGACLTRVASGMDGLLMTRPLLEAAVRARVLALPNVKGLENAAAESLLMTNQSDRVTGIRVDGQMLSADLTVDATGRGSRTPQWLESLGYEKPREDAVQIALGYTTRFFRRRPTDLGGDLAAIIPPTAHGKRGGVMLAQEGDRWTVTLISHFLRSAPDDLRGFLEFARDLPARYIHDVIQHAEPLGEAAQARFPASVRRRYEAMKRFPTGYLVFGDAICSFNPIYGQGMSVAALEAVQLQKSLAANGSNLAAEFFRRAAKGIDIPWSIAVGNDLRMPEAIGPRTAGVRFINWYMSKLHKAAQFDPVPALAFHRVGNLLEPPASIMHPRVVGHVLWGNVRRSLQSRPHENVPSAAAGRTRAFEG
jgi:2-polyprenyl-6-methoxyphenol hydroxylase-like FAD-dependent oxidoreductase